MNYGTVGKKREKLRNVTGIEVEYYNKVDFSDLEAEVRDKDGWYINFSETGERNLGQAAVLGDIVTFTTYVPDNDLCASEGWSYLYGLYYKTGTAYWKGVLKTGDNNWTGIDDGKVVYKIGVGKGYSTTPNIHTGREAGSKAFIQTSTGAIIGIEQANPGITKSGKVSWQER